MWYVKITRGKARLGFYGFRSGDKSGLQSSSFCMQARAMEVRPSFGNAGAGDGSVHKRCMKAMEDPVSKE